MNRAVLAGALTGGALAVLGWSGARASLAQLDALRLAAAQDAAIAGAADARERGLVTCRECRDRQLPGRMDGNVCQGCAEAGGAMH